MEIIKYSDKKHYLWVLNYLNHLVKMFENFTEIIPTLQQKLRELFPIGR